MKMKVLLITLLIFTMKTYADDKEIQLVRDKADAVICILENQNYSQLLKFLDKSIGVYVSDSINIPFNEYNHFTYEQIKNIITDETIYSLKINDDPSEPWKTSILHYFESRFTINHSLLSKSSFNKYISEIDWYMGNETILNEVKNSLFIEYYYVPSGKYGDIDWISIFVIFKKIDNNYILVGISRNYMGA